MSDISDEIKRDFFHAVVSVNTSVLTQPHERTTWTLRKGIEKKLDENFTRVLKALVNKFLKQHPTEHQLYSHLPPILKHPSKTNGHVRHCWRTNDELISDLLLCASVERPIKN